MGKKYIIELPENAYWIQWIMEGTINHHPYMDYKQVEDLTPYAEPDMEQVKKEAYQCGYETAKHECEDCNANAVKIADDKAHEAYQKGLNDAWEAARKIKNMSCYSRNEIFGTEFSDRVFERNTPSEAIEKIRAYEQKQEGIKVGDEVIAPMGVAVITEITDERFSFVHADGSHGFDYKRDVPRKTGRHFPEIAEVLQKMKEKNDNK